MRMCICPIKSSSMLAELNKLKNNKNIRSQNFSTFCLSGENNGHSYYRRPTEGETLQMVQWKE